MNIRTVAVATAVLLLAGCASVPKPLQGEFASQSPQQGGTEGERVRWGGSVIAVEPLPDRTCFQVLGRPLGTNGRPRETDASEGRFLACRAGFYDPAVFTAGRELTVVGVRDGSDTRTVGEFQLQLPRIAADAIHLWPRTPRPALLQRSVLLLVAAGLLRLVRPVDPLSPGAGRAAPRGSPKPGTPGRAAAIAALSPAARPAPGRPAGAGGCGTPSAPHRGCN